ncbi:hypothetical protein ABVK25_005564 [Lepraria finkii]|uniref:Uncharacterized protein n=1 Tax=Lepraria finkii TaxID=1340010 RepID=A0ABR4B8E7_9LECA
MAPPSGSRASLVHGVSSLPAACSIDVVGSILGRSLETSLEELGLMITSLESRKWATLTFQNPPLAILSAKTVNQWTFGLSQTDNSKMVGSQALTVGNHFHVLTVLNTPKASPDIIDCIVVCGLGGNAFSSFKEKGGSCMWLRDILPTDVLNLRVLLYGYDSSRYSSSLLERAARSIPVSDIRF